MSCAVSLELVTAVEPSADTACKQEHLMPAAQDPQHMCVKIAAGMCMLGWSQVHAGLE
jgi:hypothetical protein